jgi:hypothetical protein
MLFRVAISLALLIAEHPAASVRLADRFHSH